MKLTIRKNGKYYQIGYYEKSKWINVKHLGTPEDLLNKLGHTKPANIPKSSEQNN